MSIAEAEVPARTWPFSRADIALIVGSFVASRLALLVVGAVALVISTPPNAPLYITDLYLHWDGHWYVSIAESGYSTAEPMWPGQTNYAFYPLYPFLMWLLASATGMSTAIAGVVVSNASFLGAFFVLFALAERWSGDKAVSRLAVMLLCVVPEGFIFSVVYTESLFLLLTTASMLLFERRQNFLAGVCAALGSATRSNGIFIVIYFGLTAFRERGMRGGLMFWREPERYLPIAMAPIGLFVFWWISMLTVGDAFAQKSTVLHGWPWTTDWPWMNMLRHVTSGDPRDAFLLVASIVMFAASISLLRRSTWPLFVYCAANFALYWSGTSSNSLLRYSVALFPIYYGVALALVQRPAWSKAVPAACFVGSLALMPLWVLNSTWVL
jgi:hypothetical protein